MKPFRKDAHLWYICEKNVLKKKSKLLFFPLLLWLVLQLAALKASYKRCRFFFQWKNSGVNFHHQTFSVFFTKPTENPQLLEPQTKNKKITGDLGRDFQSFISGVVDSPNPETPMFEIQRMVPSVATCFRKCFLGTNSANE